MPLRLASPDESSGDAYRGTVIDPPKDVADFNLTSNKGTPFSLANLRGRPALIYFGYTHCPDFCPTTMGVWKQVRVALGDAAQRVSFVMISVDPTNDTPAVLSQYLAKFDPSFIGLTGDESSIRAAGKDFGLYFERPVHDASGDRIDHASHTYLLDQRGRVTKVYAYGVPAEVFVADLKKLLR